MLSWQQFPGFHVRAPARLAPDLQPRAQLRVEALQLSAGGMRVPQLATHLDCCESTVHSLLHRFAA